MIDKVKVWFDAEHDYLEVTFSDAAGYMWPTKSDAVMQRVDEQGHVIGFSVFGVSRFRKDRPLEAELPGGAVAVASLPNGLESQDQLGQS